MDAILPVHVLSESLRDSHCELCEGRQEVVDRPCVAMYVATGHKRFVKGSAISLHSGTSRPEAGRAPHPNYNVVRSIG